MIIIGINKWNRYLDLRASKQKSFKRIQKRIKNGAPANLQRRNAMYRKELQSKMTDSEIIFGGLLAVNNIPFIPQKGFFYPFHRIVDFYVPRINLIIEIDGEYHKTIKEKDENKDTSFQRERDMITLRLTNSMLKTCREDINVLLQDIYSCNHHKWKNMLPTNTLES